MNKKESSIRNRKLGYKFHPGNKWNETISSKVVFILKHHTGITATVEHLPDNTYFLTVTDSVGKTVYRNVMKDNKGIPLRNPDFTDYIYDVIQNTLEISIQRFNYSK